MFRILIWCFLFVVILAAAPFLLSHNGQVIIYFGEYSYTLSLLTFLVIFLVALGVLEVLACLARWLYHLFFDWYLQRRQRRQAKADRLVEKGLRQALVGDYRQAQKTLAKSATKANLPFYNLSQTFDLAIRNRNTRLAKDLLIRMLENSQGTAQDQKIIDLSKLKYFVATKQWQKASNFLSRIRLNNSTEEVLLLARNVYLHTNQYALLEDLLPQLVRQEYLAPEQAQQDLQWAYHGFIQRQLKEQNNNPQALVTWFEAQNREHRSDLLFRNQMLQTLIKLEAYLPAIDLATQTLRRCPLEQVEASNFFELVGQIPHDSPEDKLCRALEKVLGKTQPATQFALMSLLARLYYRQNQYEQAQTWIDKLISDDKELSPDTMLLAQVVYRKNNAREKLLGLTNLIDTQYNLSETTANTPATASDENADK